MSSNLKFHDHITKITSSANQTANLIFKCFECKERNFLLKMFNVFVRPKVEYASSVWNSFYQMDINKIEQVQRRFTKRLAGLANFSYPERLNILNIQSLEARRLRADLIYVYKLLHNIVSSDYKQFFTLKDSVTRGHNWSLVKPNCKIDCLKFSFAHRVINPWNSLPRDMVNALNIEIFTRLLADYDLSRFLKGRGLGVIK